LGLYCDRGVCEEVLRSLGYRVTDGGSELHATKMLRGGRLHVVIEGTGFLLSGNMVSAHLDISGKGLVKHPVVYESQGIQKEVGRIRSALLKTIKAAREKRRGSG